MYYVTEKTDIVSQSKAIKMDNATTRIHTQNPETANNTNWYKQGACVGTQQLDMFFCDDKSEDEANYVAKVAEAKRICLWCPVKQECLDTALDRKEIYGIWGGKTYAERKRYRLNQKRQLLKQQILDNIEYYDIQYGQPN